MIYRVVGFNSERNDPVSGNTHLGNGYRTYNPDLMRFNCPDAWSPFGSGGINLYAYCAGDPVNHTDPSGHMSWKAGLGIALGVAGIAGAILTSGASLVAASSLSAALATTSAATLTTGISALAADVTGLASIALTARYPQAATALGWVSLAAGLLSLGASIAAGGYRMLDRATAALQGRLVRVNGRTGIVMSGEFRNARFLGASHRPGGLSWNLRFEDMVPLGRRLTIIMGTAREGNVIRPLNELSIDGEWVPHIYTPALFRNLIVAPHEDFAVYRLAMPNSAKIIATPCRTVARDFHHVMSIPKPVIGFRGTVSPRGPLADALREVFGLFSVMEERIPWDAAAAQIVLDAASARFGEVEGAITFEGQQVVTPRVFQTIPNELN